MVWDKRELAVGGGKKQELPETLTRSHFTDEVTEAQGLSPKSELRPQSAQLENVS